MWRPGKMKFLGRQWRGQFSGARCFCIVKKMELPSRSPTVVRTAPHRSTKARLWRTISSAPTTGCNLTHPALAPTTQAVALCRRPRRCTAIQWPNDTPVLLAPDEAAIRARRILESLIAEEARHRE